LPLPPAGGGDEWEPIKIFYDNLAYVPTLTHCASLLTQSLQLFLSHENFNEHLPCMTENPPRKYSKNLGKLEPWIRWLKNEIGFHLQASAIRHGENGDSQAEA
jgi:hypothetical protein